MITLRKGNEPNLLRLVVDEVDIVPFSQMRKGMIEDGIILKMSRYNLEDLLIQLLDDYGEEELIRRIKELE